MQSVAVPVAPQHLTHTLGGMSFSIPSFDHCAVSRMCVVCGRVILLFPGTGTCHPGPGHPCTACMSNLKRKDLASGETRHLHVGQNRQYLTLSDYLDGRPDLRSIIRGRIYEVSIRAE
jgi:hypothetical protein